MGKNIFWFVLGLFLFSTPLAAQQGSISGTIIDEATGETLIGSNVVIEGTAIGTSTDFDGKYQFQADPGTYTLVVSYIGYSDKKVEGVEFKANETTYLDVALGDESVELDLEVVVTAKVIERTENAILMLQKKSDKIQDGISSQEIARLGVGDAAGALKKVTGTTIVDGKYVYVRGLGDRYSSTSLNGTRLPSIDPYRNSAQLDLIPSNLLDNIIASKTFTPDLPGDFTGGSVNIKTKTLPERFTYSISASAGYNSQSSFVDDFLSFDAGDQAWLGFNDGTLDRPAILTDPKVTDGGVLLVGSASDARTDDEVASLLDQSIRSVDHTFVPSEESTPVNYSFSFSVGNQFKLGDMPLGFLFSINHSNEFQYYNDGIQASFFNPGGGQDVLFQNFAFQDRRSVENPTLGGLFGLSLRPSPNHAINFNTIYSHQAFIEGRLLSGDQNDYGFGDPNVFESRTLSFLERTLVDYIFSGEHVFTGANNLRIDWALSFIQSDQFEPDLRFFANGVRNRPNRDPVYSIAASLFDLPGHFYRELEDQSTEGKVDITLPILQSKSKANKLKFGGLYSTKERDFSESIYRVLNRLGNNYAGVPEDYFGSDNIGIIGGDPGNNTIGLYFVDESRLSNSYSGEFNVFAAYGMGTFQLSPKLKMIAGARLEGTDIYVESAAAEVSQTPEDEIADINETDILPAAHFIYELTEEMNLRLSYSNTLARPNMREVAPFGSFGFIGDPIVFGNPDLVRSRINNYDIRYEFYIRPGELFAVSGFYKQFQDPIVITYRPAGAPQYTWENSTDANLFGVELEIRKALDFISPSLDKFSVSANFAYIYSQVDLDQQELDINRAVDPDFPDTRQFQGQSPFVANANLSFTDPDNGWDAILAYNYFDDRLFAVGIAGTPDIFERGRSTLDFSISKSINRVTLKLRGQNLLNPDYEAFNEFEGTEYIFYNYRRGVTVSFGVSYKM